MYSGNMWDTIAFSTVTTSPTVMSLLATAYLTTLYCIVLYCNVLYCTVLYLPLASSYLKVTPSLMTGYSGLDLGMEGSVVGAVLEEIL